MRIMRSAAISAKQQDYVKAARALGASTTRVIVKHLLPNCLAPVRVYATIALGAFIGVEATLSFLGIGVRPPTSTWGSMINEGFVVFSTTPWPVLLPALCISIILLAFTFVGDGLRDALDPRSRT
jgi:oligopeptide transport system permease protein